jgi:hypothetical protein
MRLWDWILGLMEAFLWVLEEALDAILDAFLRPRSK